MNNVERSSIINYLIVGSGPSGIAVANYLIENGIRPTIVDGGLESSKDDHKTISINRSDKTWFGSAMSYFQPASAKLSYGKNVDGRASFSRGGFSRVWGATFDFVMDYSEWPIEMIPTQNDIESVKKLVPHGTTSWTLESTIDGLKGSSRSHDFYSRVIDRAKHSDWKAKPSTIAIDNHQVSINRCIACKQCLMGCPSDAIWFSGDILKMWESQDLIDYRPGFVVQHIDEADHVVIQMTDSQNKWQQVHANKVFLATGAIGTASIVVKSKLQEEVVIRDTSTAIGAAIQIRASHRGENENYHTLSQWWINSQGLLAQVYPPSDDLVFIMLKRFRLPKQVHRLVRLVVMRIHPVIAYVPMENSGHIRVCLAGEEVKISGYSGDQSPRRAFKSELSQLSKLFFRSGYLMNRFMFQFKGLGGGYHHGSSFPQGPQSDNVGRPEFFKNVHIVDSSVLPCLPVGSITPTVMANAVRIVRLVLSEKKS